MRAVSTIRMGRGVAMAISTIAVMMVVVNRYGRGLIETDSAATNSIGSLTSSTSQGRKCCVVDLDATADDGVFTGEVDEEVSRLCVGCNRWRIGNISSTD